jgi:hypothetical protein
MPRPVPSSEHHPARPHPATRLPLFGLSALLLAAAAAPATAQTFTSVGAAVFGAHVSFSTGAAWVDFDNDGDHDLYVVTGFGTNRNNVLYRNEAGTFVVVPGVPLVLDNADTACSAWADYDNDGDLDVFVSNLATGDGRLYTASAPGVLAANLAAGLPASLKGVGCAWADYDNDGFVDLVIAALFGQGGITTANRLFHNDGDGTFTEVTTGPVVTTTGTFHHPTWADYDGDGDQDLFFATGSISGGTNVDRMYRNQLAESGSATFVAITTAPIATDLRSSQTLQWIDYDNDGDLDMFAINYNTVPCQLYRNDGAGAFTKIVSGALVTDLGIVHGGTWGDFDNDGDLDVFLATDLGQSNRYYRNDGGSTFTRILTGGFVTEARSNYGAASADYDGDGDLDLFVPTARTEGASVLWRNDLAAGPHWLRVVPVGTLSNHTAIGARVRVLATIGGAPRWQTRVLQTGTGYGGHDALELHFGLGDAVTVDSLVVNWPSGLLTRHGPYAPDQRIVVTEDATTAVLASLAELRATPERVEIAWAVEADAGTPVVIERRDGDFGWATLRHAEVSPQRRVSLVDTAVKAGATYTYRLGIDELGVREYVGETSVTVPRTHGLALLAIDGIGASGGPRARVTLPSATRVSLDVFDANGRRRIATLHRDLAAGEHEITLDPDGTLDPGVYWVRMTAGSRVLVDRAVRMR